MTGEAKRRIRDQKEKESDQPAKSNVHSVDPPAKSNVPSATKLDDTSFIDPTTSGASQRKSSSSSLTFTKKATAQSTPKTVLCSSLFTTPKTNPCSKVVDLCSSSSADDNELSPVITRKPTKRCVNWLPSSDEESTKKSLNKSFDVKGQDSQSENDNE